MDNLISQREISQRTGLERSFVSFALATVRPKSQRNGYFYDIDEAKAALMQYCEKRANSYSKKVAHWTEILEKSKNL